MKRIALILAGLSLVVSWACIGAEVTVVQTGATPTEIKTASTTPEPTFDFKAVEADTESRLQALTSRISTQLVTDGGSSTCLSELLAELRLVKEGQTACATADLDGDGQDDYAVRLFLRDQPDFSFGTIVIFSAGSGYAPVFRLRDAYEVEPPDTSYWWPSELSILGARDFNGDGKVELAGTSHGCGAHTCHVRLFLVGSISGPYALLVRDSAEAPFGVIGAPEAENQIRFDDVNGDGLSDLIFRQGGINSAGAGYQRLATDTYLWDGERYAFSSRVFDRSNFRYFKVRDADDAFASGDFASAIDLYQGAMNSPDLTDFTEYFARREELIAYSGFRVALAYIKLADTSSASKAIEQTISSWPGSLHGRAANEFRNATSLTEAGMSGSITDGCSAVTRLLTENMEHFREVWSYGYANPTVSPVAICPF